MSQLGPQTYPIPGLATVVIDTRDNGKPIVTINLDPCHLGIIDAVSVDIDDMMSETWNPGGVYFCNKADGADQTVLLAQFMELCVQWDADHDGRYDADEALLAIMKAVPESALLIKLFVRPANGLYARALMALMPPAPLRHIIMSYRDLKPRFRRRHYLMAIPALAVVLGLVTLQVHLLPWMANSVITGGSKLIDAYGWPLVAAIVAVYVLANRIVSRRFPPRSGAATSVHTYGFFSRAAVSEEQTFREGAENWNVRQRVTSCLVFGAIHMVNLFYPLATIIPLALGGAVFMNVYLRNLRKSGRRRNAVLEAALVHRVYNRLAICVAVLSLLHVLGAHVLSLLGFTVALGITWLSMAHSNLRNQTPQATPNATSAPVRV